MPIRLWKKGECGNPAGRPKGTTEFNTKCREWANKYGLGFLIALVMDETADIKLRQATAVYLINRGHGTPTEMQEMKMQGDLTLYAMGKKISNDPETSRVATALIQRLSLEQKDADGS